jgi:hypothetical protein
MSYISLRCWHRNNNKLPLFDDITIDSLEYLYHNLDILNKIKKNDRLIIQNYSISINESLLKYFYNDDVNKNVLFINYIINKCFTLIKDICYNYIIITIKSKCNIIMEFESRLKYLNNALDNIIFLYNDDLITATMNNLIDDNQKILNLIYNVLNKNII